MKKIKNVPEKVKKQIIKSKVLIFSSIIKPASLLARRIFESKKIQQITGLSVVFWVFSIAVLPVFISDIQTVVQTRFSPANQDIVEIKTLKSVQLPVEGFRISQGFHLFHPGLDLAAVKGSPVFPVMEGTVEKVARDRWAWGNHVIVNHGSGLKSVYAHLSKIEVKDQEKITPKSILGLVGSTGHSTGPHLHLQIWQDGRWVNPRTFFESYFGQRLASTR